MHLAEGLLSAKHASIGFVAAAPFVVYSARSVSKVLRAGEPKDRAILSMCTALAFALTLFPVPVPVAGATSHMCATPLLGILFGPIAFAFPAAAILLLQALFFAHGGITTLGANTFTLGVIGPAMAWAIFHVLKKIPGNSTWKIALACCLGSVSVYLADAAILATSLHDQTTFSEWFWKIALAFLPIQLPLSMLEGALSAALVVFLGKKRPVLTSWLKGRIAASVLILFALAAPLPASAHYSGLDEVVFSKISEDGGRPAQAPWIPIEGEVLLFTFSLGTFLAGIVVGKSWETLGRLPEKK